MLGRLGSQVHFDMINGHGTGVGNKTNKPNGPLTSALKNFDKPYPTIVKDYDYPITKSCL